MEKTGKIIIGVVVLLIIIVGGYFVLSGSSSDAFTTGIQNASQLDNQTIQKMNTINNDSTIAQSKEVFQAVSDNCAKELQIFDTISNITQDQNEKDYIAIQKERVTALKQVADHVVELSDSSEQGTLTYANFKSNDDIIKNAFSTYYAKERETKEFLNNHSDIKDKINQVSTISDAFLGDDITQ